MGLGIQLMDVQRVFRDEFQWGFQGKHALDGSSNTSTTTELHCMECLNSIDQCIPWYIWMLIQKIVKAVMADGIQTEALLLRVFHLDASNVWLL